MANAKPKCPKCGTEDIGIKFEVAVIYYCDPKYHCKKCDYSGKLEYSATSREAKKEKRKA